MKIEQTAGYISGFPAPMNIRELGGIEVADGRRIRHGLFFRGSALTGLSPEQHERIDNFGLRSIIDLRATNETLGQEDYVPEDAEYRHVAGMYAEDGSEMDFSPAAIEHFMTAYDDPMLFMRTLYVSMAHGNPAMHAVVDWLVEGKVPLYFHCSAGKDRTGIVAALILTLLGVPDEAIIEDFLLTNLYRAELIENPPAVLPPFVESNEQWARANGVDPEDLLAVLASMDKGVSSREEYFEKEYGLDEAAVKALRNRYLE